MKEIIGTGIVSAITSLIVVAVTIWLNKKVDYKLEYKKLIEDVDFHLFVYANCYCNVIDRSTVSEKEKEMYDDASFNLRKLAARMHAFANAKYKKDYDGVLNEEIIEASKLMVGISNNLWTPHNLPDGSNDSILSNRKNAESIRKYLRIRD